MNHLSFLIFRVVLAGSMAFGHGMEKLVHFQTKSATFPSVFGMGSKVSLILAIFAEFFCAIAVMAGFATRLAAIPLLVTMAVAFFIIHGNDPFSHRELSGLYLVGFALIFMNGAGNWSIDGLLNQDGFLRKSR
ncbi:MAG: DoxX family protein [Bdellovibrionales bacterium]|nr:DoxX family protein [Bdellovibrionales bacterium]